MTLEAIQRGQGGFLAHIARAALTALSWGWGAVQGLKSLAYRVGIRRATALGRPVLSIGNLVAGGAGKTPFVIALAHAMRERGRVPGVLARGYRRAPGARLNDEGLEIARALPGIAQEQDPDRVAAARRLLAAHAQVDVILLDDGFQHRRVTRSVDVVLLDALDPFGGGRLLPRGRLRERPAALARADVVVLTRTDLCEDAALVRIEERVRLLTEASVVRAHTRATAVWDAATRHEPVFLHGKTVHLAAGIARPDAVRRTLERLGATVAHVTAFRDHVPQSSDTWQALVQQAQAAGASALVTTRKDAVKWDAVPAGIWVLDVCTELPPGLVDVLIERLGR